jgi:hypothetical protein
MLDAHLDTDKRFIKIFPSDKKILGTQVSVALPGIFFVFLFWERNWLLRAHNFVFVGFFYGSAVANCV